MTKDAWVSLIVKILLMVLTPLAAQLHINDGATLSAFATDLADIIVLGFGMYQQWNMKRVPQDSVAIHLLDLPSDPGLQRLTQRNVGSVIKLPDAAKVIGALLVAFLLSALLLPSAFAQTGNIAKDIAAARASRSASAAPKAAAAAPATSTTDPLTKLMDDLAAVQNDVVTGVIADITAADADAGSLTNESDPTSFKDPISHACYPAEIKFLQSLPVATPTTGKYVLVQLFQKKRDFVAQIQAGLPVYLKLGCAPLLGDEISILTKSLSLIGVSIAANSLLPGSGFVLPTL